MATSKESFNLVFFPAYPRCLVPMDFGEMNRSVRESDFRDTFPLAPSACPIGFPQSGKFANPRSNRECFNVCDWANELKVHGAMVPKADGVRQWERARALHTCLCIAE